MKLLKTLLYSFISITIISCSSKEEVPANIEVQDFVWKGLNAYYLWQDQIPDLADRRFNNDQELYSYLSSFNDPNNLFNSLLVQTDTISKLIPNLATITTPVTRNRTTNGMEFGIIAQPGSTDNVIGYITHILPNSDAVTKNIVRGEFFYAVDDTQLTRSNFEALLENGANNFTLNMANFDGTNVTPNAKNVDLVKTSYDYPGVFKEQVIVDGTNTIGYLMYNNDFSTNYLADLNSSFANFKGAGTNQLVLDLRYNIGGGSFAKNITKIASMITGQFTDEVFIKEQWNTKAQAWFEANQPDSLLTKFTDKLNTTTTINSLNLTDVYIILNGVDHNASSAIELLINSLKAHINVHVIGTQSIGRNMGSITLYNSEDYNFDFKSNNHTFALQPVALTFLNKNNETYDSGISPNMTLCTNEDALNLGVLGTNTDPILNRVLNYISTGSAGVNPPCNVDNFEYLYNSITRQKEIDRGVFITQVLPNTNR
ncbi:MAG: S41 family peptidase [Tenacibaculum sp.]